MYHPKREKKNDERVSREVSEEKIKPNNNKLLSIIFLSFQFIT